MKGVASICSELAAEHYGLEILEKGASARVWNGSSSASLSWPLQCLRRVGVTEG